MHNWPLGRVAAILLLISGCASQIMESYIGQPVQNVVLDYGLPESAMDLPDGRRAFQWIMIHTKARPARVETRSYGTLSHNVASSDIWLTSRSKISGGGVIENRCIYTLITEWRDDGKAWYVVSYRRPSLKCEGL